MSKPDKNAAAPMRHCYWCGCQIGRYADFDFYDTCGAQDCEREARRAAADERKREEF